MEKIKLHQITDGPLELIPYRPDIFAKNEVEYRYKLALYLYEIGVCESVLLSSDMFQNYYLLVSVYDGLSSDLPRLPLLYKKYRNFYLPRVILMKVTSRSSTIT